MKREDVIREAREVERELRQSPEEEEQPQKRSLHPLLYIIAFLLALLVILMAVPYYGVEDNPRPERVPSIAEVVPDNLTVPNTNHSLSSRADFRRFIQPGNPRVKFVANRIATISCQGHRVCYAKAMLGFVQENFKYVGDPPDDYIETFEESLLTGGSDCDGHAALLASLLEAVGINSELVFVPGHVLVRARLPEAPNRYKNDGDYVYMDPTCKTCEFGEIPRAHREQPMSFLEV